MFLGVSDRGTTTEFNEFAELTAKHPRCCRPSILWGNSLNEAYERWRETATWPILHISTADDQTLAELITPAQIALGYGDDYLLQLNDFFASKGLPAYIRPLGEPNRCLNAWSAVNCDGSQKGGEHTTGWYKQAFRRIVAIVRGGQSLEGVNATLAEIGLPPVSRTKARRRRAAGGAGQHHLEPAARRLAAGQRQLPGQLLAGAALGRLGRHRLLLAISRLGRPQPLLRRQTVEGQTGGDDRVGGLRRRRPRWVKQTIAWTVKHPRVRMLVYYQGFGPGNPYDLRLYPRTTNTLRLKIRRPNFLSTADYNAGLYPPCRPSPAKNSRSDTRSRPASPAPAAGECPRQARQGQERRPNPRALRASGSSRPAPAPAPPDAAQGERAGCRASVTWSAHVRHGAGHAATGAAFASGGSAMIASVTRMFFAIEAAFSRAERVTLVGSMTPALIRSP